MYMKVVNIMNFVRRIDERMENSTERLLAFTKAQLQIVKEFQVDHTFLLQYDALCDADFVSLFKAEATERTELGLWLEIVAPLTDACGMPYRSENGWVWDWHIIPGYSMAYLPDERERLIDEAMRKFREVFGTYPRTVAGWVIDTHTLNYLAEHYDIAAVAICRDQENTDAYTLRGGYFNGAYYPSKNNVFTPAQSRTMQTDIPVFRLLGPCPVHNYDNHKYSSEAFRSLGERSACFTLEPCWYMGSTEETARWLFDCFYGSESLGFAYAQTGQENSFVCFGDPVLRGLRMQIEMLLARGDVLFQKMGDTGAWFRRTYAETPPTSVCALNHFDDVDVQSVYYDCKSYTANLFRFERTVFFRSLFLFDERIPDRYMKDTCTTFDAVYENLPIVDTAACPEAERDSCGLILATDGAHLVTEKPSDGVLRVRFGERAVTFFPDRIEIDADVLTWREGATAATVTPSGDGLTFDYNGHAYALGVEGASITPVAGGYELRTADGHAVLYPKRI